MSPSLTQNALPLTAVATAAAAAAAAITATAPRCHTGVCAVCQPLARAHGVSRAAGRSGWGASGATAVRAASSCRQQYRQQYRQYGLAVPHPAAGAVFGVGRFRDAQVGAARLPVRSSASIVGCFCAHTLSLFVSTRISCRACVKLWVWGVSNGGLTTLRVCLHAAAAACGCCCCLPGLLVCCSSTSPSHCTTSRC